MMVCVLSAVVALAVSRRILANAQTRMAKRMNKLNLEVSVNFIKHGRGKMDACIRVSFASVLTKMGVRDKTLHGGK